MFDVTLIVVGAYFSAFLSCITYFALTVTKEFKNSQGFACRCYLVSYTVWMIFLGAFTWQLDVTGIDWSGLPNYNSLFFRTGCAYFLYATILWLNVMSFDIWSTFRKCRSNPNAHIIEPSIPKLRYSIYVCGSSVAICLTLIVGATLDAPEFTLAGLIIPFIAIPICDIYFFISSAFMITQRRRETVEIVKRSDKLHQENVKWLIADVLVFVSMISMLILVRIEIFTSSPLFIASLAPLQSVATFLIFISKVEVRRSIQSVFQSC